MVLSATRGRVLNARDGTDAGAPFIPRGANAQFER